jgi:hypothetical protein
MLEIKPTKIYTGCRKALVEIRWINEVRKPRRRSIGVFKTVITWRKPTCSAF